MNKTTVSEQPNCGLTDSDDGRIPSPLCSISEVRAALVLFTPGGFRALPDGATSWLPVRLSTVEHSVRAHGATGLTWHVRSALSTDIQVPACRFIRTRRQFC